MKRYKHSLSHYRLLTGNMGELLPVGCVEVLPGDSFDHQCTALIRLSPLVTPVMHPVNVRLHQWFVPNRHLWNVDNSDNWEKFITGAESGWTFPKVTLSSPTETSLSTYLGVPPVDGLAVNAMPIRAYNKIVNEFYRDQDLVSEVAQDSNVVQKIAWEKDYFTSARPWAQKGTQVTVPLGDKAPVIGIGKKDQTYGTGPFAAYETGASATRNYADAQTIDFGTEGQKFYVEEDPNNAGFPSIYADLQNVTGTDIVTFRRAFALQRFQEARARFGSRFAEYLRYIGISPSDGRLQRPEYLGGGKTTISFSEVLQTAPDSTSSTVVGELRGHGIAAVRTRPYRRFFEEHGHVLTLMSIRPKVMYLEACHRNWFRDSHTDYWQKELENIGAQAIEHREIYANDANTTVFGYGDRYREYREQPSLIAGEFRSSLNSWHYARDLSAEPTLNGTFVTCTPNKNPHADLTNANLWCMVNHRLRARRLVSKRARSSLG